MKHFFIAFPSRPNPISMILHPYPALSIALEILPGADNEVQASNCRSIVRRQVGVPFAQGQSMILCISSRTFFTI